MDPDSPAGAAYPAIGNTPEWTVTALSAAIRGTLEDSFGRVRVRGELGRVSRPASGHVYLDLKDAGGVLAAVIWRSRAERLAIRPAEGMEVVASGRITAYARQSRYQLQIDQLQPAGEGAILAAIERLRRQLQAEGLFAAGRKRPLPALPEVVGVVTSASGAVIRDILHRIRARRPCRVLVWPAAMQGQSCPVEVAAAIAGFNALPADGPVPRPDVLILARGGGSVEDLAGFSDEAVVRAVAASDIPLISAIGHETDLALTDHAADRRAPTPTAAAEMAVPEAGQLADRILALDGRRGLAAARALERLGLRLAARHAALPRAEALLAEPVQRCDHAASRLAAATAAGGAAARARLQPAASRLRPALLRQRAERAAQRHEAAWQSLRRQSRHGVGLCAARATAITGRLRRSDRLRQCRDSADRVTALDRRLRRLTADMAAAPSAARFRRAAESLQPALLHRLDRQQAGLATLARVLDTLGYRNVLARGYAVVRRRPGGELVTDPRPVAAGSAIEIEFREGRRLAATTDSGATTPARPGIPAG